jgi:hypothetical protein
MLTAVAGALAAPQAATFVQGGPVPLTNVTQHVAQLKLRGATSGLPATKPEFTCPLPKRPG